MKKGLFLQFRLTSFLSIWFLFAKFIPLVALKMKRMKNK